MKLNKPYSNEEYADLAVYCNNNKCEIADKGEYLEAVVSKPPFLSDEEKSIIVRRKRNALIENIKWRIERYKSQQELLIDTTDDYETYMQILSYIQYLRDIPIQDGFPNIELNTFEQWQELIEKQSIMETE